MLSVELQRSIQEHIADTIAEKRLTADLLEIIYDQNWFNLWVPKRYGGLNFELSKGCRMLEEIAYIDGGIGWTVTLCSGANMFAGFIEPKLAQTIFSQRNVCWGGSGMASGTAEKVNGGYILNGNWKYATGAPHLTHFTLNATVLEKGKQMLDSRGQPLVHSFYVLKDDVLVHDDWDTFGLECTASHSFSTMNLKVSNAQCFDLQYEKRRSEEPLFDYSFLSFAECTLGVNYIGMARRFLDLFEKQLLVKVNTQAWDSVMGKFLFKQIDASRTIIQSFSDRLYGLMRGSWGKGRPSDDIESQISEVTEQCVQHIRTSVSALFPFTGIAGAQRHNEINIVFRHLFTASQHALLNRKPS
ncbi:MAG: acyl-CoA dehydrogenase family protein [Sphingobacterium sp.]